MCVRVRENCFFFFVHLWGKVEKIFSIETHPAQYDAHASEAVGNYAKVKKRNLLLSNKTERKTSQTSAFRSFCYYRFMFCSRLLFQVIFIFYFLLLLPHKIKIVNVIIPRGKVLSVT